MVPVTDEDGNIQTKSTKQKVVPDHAEVSDWEHPKTVRTVYYRHDTPRGIRYMKSQDYKREEETEKILYEVTGEDGNTSEMTKDGAKTAYSARQVRKAIKRLPQETRWELKNQRRRVKGQYDPSRDIVRELDDVDFDEDIPDPVFVEEPGDLDEDEVDASD